MPVKVVSQEQALQAFKALDVDNSGALTAAELSKILMRPGDEAFSEEEATAKAKELIEKFDKNGDGVLQYEEFIAWWSKSAKAVVPPSYVFDKQTSYIIKEKFFSLGSSDVKDEKGETLFDVPFKVLSLATKMRLVDHKTKIEILDMEQLILAMSATMYIKKGGEIIMTLRKKMLSWEGEMYVYEGKAEFDWGNNTKAKKLFTLVGFGMKIGQSMFGGRIDDATGKTVATIRETILTINDTYTLVVEPGVDASIMCALMLCLDKMKTQGDGGGGH